MASYSEKGLSYFEISNFCRQIARLFNAGITPNEALHILIKDTDNAGYSDFLSGILDSLKQGERFHDALRETDMFPDYVTNLIKLGEETGSLDTVSESLAIYYENEDNLRANIKSAVTYPIIMVVLMLVVVTVVLRNVLPVFEQVFTEMGASMDGLGTMFLNIGKAISKYSLAINIVLLLAYGIFLFFYLTNSGKESFDSFLSKFPPTRHFQHEVAVGRFASSMSVAMHSGLSTYDSLKLSSEIVGNEEIKGHILKAAEDIRKGSSLTDALSESKMLSNVYLSMLEVASRTGNTDQVMAEIANQYVKENDRKMNALISAVEPFLVILLSVVVGAILLSVILPLMGIMTGIN